MNGAVKNTDKELWRDSNSLSEANGRFYADSIHVTADGGIGINCGGLVIVMTLRKWHALAVEAQCSLGANDGS